LLQFKLLFVLDFLLEGFLLLFFFGTHDLNHPSTDVEFSLIWYKNVRVLVDVDIRILNQEFCHRFDRRRLLTEDPFLGLSISRLFKLFLNLTHNIRTVSIESKQKFSNISDVLRGTTDCLLQVLWLILETVIENSILKLHGAELGQVTLPFISLALNTLLNLFIKSYHFLSVVEDTLTGVVWRALRSADRRVVGRGNHLDEVLVVKGQNLARDALDTWVDQVETIFTSINVGDDSVVDVDESVFSSLDWCQHSVEELNLVHFVGAQVDACLL
jgi:hypothetical protein